MFNLLLPLSMQGLKTKTNLCINSKYLCISGNDLEMLFSLTDITVKHKMTEKCKISLQNVIKISVLHRKA